MITWVLYDISDNARRSRIASICLDHGLARFQYSIYLGDLDAHMFNQLESSIKRYAADLSEQESLLIFTVCDTCLGNQTVFGKPFDTRHLKRPSLVIIG